MIRLQPTSWKIMLEVLVKGDPAKVVEVPIAFGERTAGESKFTFKQMQAYLKHLLLLVIHRYRAMLRFGVVGLGAACIHFALLYAFTEVGGLWYILSAVFSIVAASTFAYTVHHKWTFRGRRIPNHFIGWVKYQFVSGASDLVYIGLLAMFVEVFGFWYMAGAFCSALLVYPVKYTVASLVIWKTKARDPNSPDYDWRSFYQGSLPQKWWKGKIANTVWAWIPNSSFLLDIGCGSSPIIARYTSALGVDANEEKVKYMRQRLGNGTKFAVMSAKNIALPAESCDYVLCIELLEHVKGSEEVVKEIGRVLKPRGKAIIATPDYNRKWWLLAEKFTPAGEAHVEHYTRKRLEDVCERHGLKPVRHKYVAGCDLVEMFVKEDRGGNGNGNGNRGKGENDGGRLQNAKIGLEIIKRYAKPRISRANFALTYVCNQRCKSCNIWQLYQGNSKVDEEVTVEEFEKVLDNNDLMWMSLTGGEPFLKQGIDEILGLCVERLELTSIVTNGTMPVETESAIKKALARGDGLLTVNVSLEGGKVCHDEFVGRNGSYEKVVETLGRLSMVKNGRLKVGIEQLVSNKVSRGNLELVESIAKSLGVSLTYTVEQNSSYYRNEGEAVGGGQVPVVEMRPEPFSIMARLFTQGIGKRKKSCVAGEFSCFIDPYCVVYPCLFYTPTEPLVNLRESGYVIGKLDCKELVGECEGCWTPCETYATMVFRPWRLL